MQDNMNEKAPLGWSGTVKAMKKKKKIDNPFALAWHMKNYEPEKKGEKPKKKKKYESKDKKDCKMESFADYVAQRQAIQEE